MASRAHQKHIVPVVNEALETTGILKHQLDAIAFTQGPGLLGALLVGSSFAKAMAWGLGIPIITVNHMQAHILAHFIDEPHPKLPFLCLTVSGGHTQLVVVEEPLKMSIIGETQDDAVGEAFDKTAKMLNLPYPGGPHVDKLAQMGNSRVFSFPITEMSGLNFSFSGIKTAILYFLRDRAKEDPEFVSRNMNDICASIQKALIDMLFQKLRKAVKQTGITEVAIAGGVAANSGLRKALDAESRERGWNVYIPKFEYCTDNAAMIAMAAHFKYMAGDFAPLDTSPEPRMKF